MTDPRPTLAAQILNGILANPERKQTTEIAVDIALKHTDELIKRAKEIEPVVLAVVDKYLRESK